jgi:CheY-like chemotaxis protein
MIVDIFMPHMRGFESVRVFHQRAPMVPLIAISGYVFAEQRTPAPDFLRMALELGATRCLRKPFTPTSVESMGYSVIATVDGNDALQKLRTDIHVDILFTDIVMPGGISGWELADLARKLRPGLPVLLTSGYALDTLVKHGRLRAGAVVLTKPYRKTDLARHLREVVSVSELLSLSHTEAPAAPVAEVERTKR